MFGTAHLGVQSRFLVCFLFSFLEGSADGFCAAGCIAGAYVDHARGAVAIAIMVHAVLYVAMDAFVVMRGLGAVAAILVFVHDSFLLNFLGC